MSKRYESFYNGKKITFKKYLKYADVPAEKLKKIFKDDVISVKDGVKGIYIMDNFFPLPDDYYDADGIIPQYMYTMDREKKRVTYHKLPDDYYLYENGCVLVKYPEDLAYLRYEDDDDFSFEEFQYSCAIEDLAKDVPSDEKKNHDLWGLCLDTREVEYGSSDGWDKVDLYNVDYRDISLLKTIKYRLDTDLKWDSNAYREWDRTETYDQFLKRIEREIHDKYKEISEWENIDDPEYDRVCRISFYHGEGNPNDTDVEYSYQECLDYYNDDREKATKDNRSPDEYSKNFWFRFIKKNKKTGKEKSQGGYLGGEHGYSFTKVPTPYYEDIVEEVTKLTDQMKSGEKSIADTKKSIYDYLHAETESDIYYSRDSEYTRYNVSGFSVAVKDKDTFIVTVDMNGFIVKISELGVKTEKHELPVGWEEDFPETSESLKPENQTPDGVAYVEESEEERRAYRAWTGEENESGDNGQTGNDDNGQTGNGDNGSRGNRDDGNHPEPVNPSNPVNPSTPVNPGKEDASEKKDTPHVTTEQVGDASVTYTDHITFHGKKASFEDGALNITDANGNKVSVKKVSIKKSTKAGSTTFKLKVDTSDKALKKAFAKKTFNVVIDPYEVTASDKVEISVNSKGKIKKVAINGIKLKKNEYSGTADSMTFSGRFTGKFAK